MDMLMEFMCELRDLEEKYGYNIKGCGCCGSPYIVDTRTGRIVAEKYNGGDFIDFFTDGLVKVYEIKHWR